MKRATNPTLFLQGRSSPRWLVLNWALGALLSIFTWNAAIEVPGAPNGALISARLTVPLVALLIHLWLVAPAMASWEVTAIRRVRVLTVWSVMGGVLLATAMVLATIWFVTGAPSAIVPGYFVGADDLLIVQWPLAQNTLILGGIAALSFCYLGRPLGTGVTIVAYLALIVVGASSAWHHLVPYFSHAFGISVSHHPIAATLLPVCAIWAWAQTGGSGRVARKLDPRA